MIQIMKKDQIRDVEQLVQKAFVPYKSIYTIKPSEKKSTFEYETIIINEHSNIIGTLSYYVDKEILRLFKIAITPESQGKGYFTKLLAYVENVAINRSISQLGLYTIKETCKYKYFEKKGFNTVSETYADFAIGTDNKPVYELEMLKNI